MYVYMVSIYYIHNHYYVDLPDISDPGAGAGEEGKRRVGRRQVAIALEKARQTDGPTEGRAAEEIQPGGGRERRGRGG